MGSGKLVVSRRMARRGRGQKTLQEHPVMFPIVDRDKIDNMVLFGALLQNW